MALAWRISLCSTFVMSRRIFPYHNGSSSWEAIMDRVERSFAVTAITGFIVLIAAVTWLGLI